MSFKSLETFLTTGECVYEMLTLSAGAGATNSKTVTKSFRDLSTPEDVRHWTDEKLTHFVSRHADNPKRTRLLNAADDIADDIDNDTIVFDVVGMRASLLPAQPTGTSEVGMVMSDLVSTPVEEASSVDT